jgi:hypothetical protein
VELASLPTGADIGKSVDMPNAIWIARGAAVRHPAERGQFYVRQRVSSSHQY